MIEAPKTPDFGVAPCAAVCSSAPQCLACTTRWRTELKQLRIKKI